MTTASLSTMVRKSGTAARPGLTPANGTARLRRAFVGVDVACRKSKHLPIAICTWEGGRLVPQRLRELSMAPPRAEGNIAALDAIKVRRFALDAASYIGGACDELGLVPTRIAIDAPMAPRRASLERRLAELAMDAAGISCFTTPSVREFRLIRHKVLRHLKQGGGRSNLPHANQLWMLVGFALFEELSEIAPCIEVFPQAIVRAIGSGAIHKSKPGAVAEQLAAASRFTGWPGPGGHETSLAPIAWGPAHDQLDAYLAAWVAALDELDRVASGKPPGDAIWVPRVNADSRIGPHDFTVPPADLRPLGATRPALPPTRAGVPRLCPACGQHEFRRWPWGWDSHAAHKCRGLNGTDPAARKSEYRRRFRE